MSLKRFNHFFKFCCILIVVSLADTDVIGQTNLSLWYKQPAEKWTDAIPIGNGRIGGMVFGSVQTEHIQFNEETLWTGEPRNYNRPDAAKYLSQIRKLLVEGKQQAAEKLAQEQFMGLQSEVGDRKAWIDRMKVDRKPSLPDYNDQLWKTIEVPAFDGWETVGLPNLDGAVWFRTTFDVPENWKGKDLILDLNRIRDQDFTFVNGQLIGETENPEPRKYTIPAKLIKVGKNTLAIQVLNYFDKGGLVGYKDKSRKIGIYPNGLTATEGISLVKKWKYHVQDHTPPAMAQYQASYQPFGDLKLHFKNHDIAASSYTRSLDLNTAIATTTYNLNKVTYKREYFASAVNQAIVVRLSANMANSISFDASLSSMHHNSSIKKLNNNTLSIAVKVKDGALHGESRLTAVVKNGILKIENDKISITSADEVTLYLTAGTNFIDASNVYGNPADANDKALMSLTHKTYAQVREAHIVEYQSYFNRFSLSFGTSENDNLPTDQRLIKFAHSDDPGFIALYLQYGRYLMISSSRPGGQPANLQGIWNDMLSPPWGSKYTTNINMEMNYWPTEILNLSRLNEPLFSKIKGLADKGRETAKNYYNASGWVLHHNTDLWNGTAPINASDHGIWVTGGAWLSQHLWEHYLFTKNKDFLAKDGYPIMKEAALFFNDFLIKDEKTGWLISSPSNSPENGGLVAGPTMDHQLIRTLLKNCIAASIILGVDDKLRKIWEEKVVQIAPNQVGKHGQLQEWLTDLDDTTNKHRHVSHLWGVYPGNDITWETSPNMMNAAKQSLLYRGDDATGWSLAWKINFWARFK
ncbi:MAG: glycosyl hydrolase family 95 catalytic domain-containing protein, partial [Bacteroidia bacterium]